MDDPTNAPEPIPGRLSFFAKPRLWLNATLFVLTVASAFAVGIGWSANYRYAEALSRHPELAGAVRPWRDPAILGLSALYAVVLIGILLGHEMGHYLTCRRNGIGATLPFFIPAPTLIGTMGAFIKITSPITRKRQLFDVGLAGPLMSFFLSVPALAIGLALSKTVPAVPSGRRALFRRASPVQDPHRPHLRPPGRRTGHHPPSHRLRRLGRPSRDGHESLPSRPARRRPYLLRRLRTEVPDDQPDLPRGFRRPGHSFSGWAGSSGP